MKEKNRTAARRGGKLGRSCGMRHLRQRRYGCRRAGALLLALAMIPGGGGTSAEAWAAPKAVSADETMYVNLDWYGQPEAVNVVKGCSLNGLRSFTDYGTYLNVENMSTMDAPEISGDQVKWNLSQDAGERFYYKCAMDPEQVELAWNFDISYKLNGVPANADELAGASGLVEIHIEAEPNARARLYDRNNMLLAAAVPVDMSKCRSVEAEGAQTQSLGDTTAVVFTALPGEKGDYTVRIGTDSFETVGVILSMFPGTLEDLEHIKDLKEAKDTWQDAGDELYDSLEQMALSVEDMREGVELAQSGAAAAERARQKWSGAKDSILAGNDQALASLSALSSQMEKMVPHLETAKDAAEVIHSSMNDIVTTLGEMQEPLRKLHTRLRGIKSGASGVAEALPELEADMETLLALDAKLQANEQVILTGLSGLQGTLADLEMDYEEEREDEKEEEEKESSEKEDSKKADSGKDSAGTGGGGGSGSGSAGSTGSSGGPSKDAETSGGSSSGEQTGDQEGSEGGAGSSAAGDSAAAEGSGSPEGGAAAGESGSPEGGAAAESGGAAGGGTAEEDSETAGGSTSTGGSASAEEGETAGGSTSEEESGPAGGSGAAEGSGTTGDSASAEGGETTGGSASAEGGGSTGDSAAAESGGSGGDSASAEESSPTGDSASPAPQSGPLASVEKKSAPRVAAPAEGSPYTLAEVAGLLGEKTAALEEIAGRSRSLARSMSNLMDDTADAAEYSQDIVDNLDYLIEDLTALNDSLDTYYPDLQEALDDSARLVERTAEALSSGVSLMTIVQNTLKASSEDMDQAARDSLAAGMQVLDKSLGILDSTEAMRRAGRVMKDTMDSQLDKFDTENRFLFMDPSAEKSSFTSEKNPEPNTLQVVLRTEEISQEENKDGMLDSELPEKQESPLKRMWNVLVKIWQAITDIFRER